MIGKFAFVFSIAITIAYAHPQPAEPKNKLISGIGNSANKEYRFTPPKELVDEIETDVNMKTLVKRGCGCKTRNCKRCKDSCSSESCDCSSSSSSSEQCGCNCGNSNWNSESSEQCGCGKTKRSKKKCGCNNRKCGC